MKPWIFVLYISAAYLSGCTAKSNSKCRHEDKNVFDFDISSREWWYSGRTEYAESQSSEVIVHRPGTMGSPIHVDIKSMGNGFYEFDIALHPKSKKQTFRMVETPRFKETGELLGISLDSSSVVTFWLSVNINNRPKKREGSQLSFTIKFVVQRPGMDGVLASSHSIETGDDCDVVFLYAGDGEGAEQCPAVLVDDQTSFAENTFCIYLLKDACPTPTTCLQVTSQTGAVLGEGQVDFNYLYEKPSDYLSFDAVKNPLNANLEALVAVNYITPGTGTLTVEYGAVCGSTSIMKGADIVESVTGGACSNPTTPAVATAVVPVVPGDFVTVLSDLGNVAMLKSIKFCLAPCVPVPVFVYAGDGSGAGQCPAPTDEPLPTADVNYGCKSIIVDVPGLAVAPNPCTSSTTTFNYLFEKPSDYLSFFNAEDTACGYTSPSLAAIIYTAPGSGTVTVDYGTVCGSTSIWHYSTVTGLSAYVVDSWVGGGPCTNPTSQAFATTDVLVATGDLVTVQTNEQSVYSSVSEPPLSVVPQAIAMIKSITFCPR